MYILGGRNLGSERFQLGKPKCKKLRQLYIIIIAFSVFLCTSCDTYINSTRARESEPDNVQLLIQYGPRSLQTFTISSART